MRKQDLVAIRDNTPEDLNFIFATFLRGLYYGAPLFSRIPKKIFMENYHNVISQLLLLPSVRVRVACLKDDPEVILGYAIGSVDDTRLHWVFVKQAWRKIGIAKSLVPASVTTVTHLTTLGDFLLGRKPEVIFNPFALN